MHPRSEATGRTLAEDYPSLEALRKAVPGLALAHNLHGVDIDPRCAQIAQIALWMRAQKAYPRTKNDVYAAFVERGMELLSPRGRLGAITSRTGFFLSSFQKWREDVLLKQAPPVVFADLGYRVLDSVMVETAAYCLERTAPSGQDLRAIRQRAGALGMPLQSVAAILDEVHQRRTAAGDAQEPS